MSQLTRFLACLLVLTLLTGNVEHARAVRAVPHQMGVVVGYHLPWSAVEFWSFATGAKPYWRSMSLAAAAVAAVLTLLGLLRTMRLRRAVLFFCNLAVFAALTAAFLILRDPWSGERGHTWSLFKICQWIYPFLLSLQVAGLGLLWRRRVLGAMASGLACVGAAYLFLPAHVEHSTNTANHLRYLAGSQHPFRSWREFGRTLDRLAAKQIYLVVPPKAEFFPTYFATYLVYPRSILNGDFLPAGPQEVPATLPPGTVCLTWCRGPFGKNAKLLPGGLSVLPSDQPEVLAVDNPNGIDTLPQGPLVWLGEQSARLVLWSPKPCTAELGFEATTGPSKPDSSRRTLTLAVPGTGAVTKSFDNADAWAHQITLPAGISIVEVSCNDKATVRLADKGEQRHLLVALKRIQLTKVEQPAADARASAGP